jgi:hypothetical protein
MTYGRGNGTFSCPHTPEARSGQFKEFTACARLWKIPDAIYKCISVFWILWTSSKPPVTTFETECVIFNHFVRETDWLSMKGTNLSLDISTRRLKSCRTASVTLIHFEINNRIMPEIYLHVHRTHGIVVSYKNSSCTAKNLVIPDTANTQL